MDGRFLPLTNWNDFTTHGQVLPNVTCPWVVAVSPRYCSLLLHASSTMRPTPTRTKMASLGRFHAAVATATGME